MLNQHQARQFNTRSLIGQRMLDLLGGASGLHLLDFKDGLDKQRGTVKLDGEINVGEIFAEGFSLDRIETGIDGSAVAHCSKVVGLKYPVPGLSDFTYDSDHDDPRLTVYPEYGLTRVPPSTLF